MLGRGTLESLFQAKFATSRVSVRRPEDGAVDAHGNPAPSWSEWEDLGRGDCQVLQGEEAPSHRSGGSEKYRIYLPADVDVPAGSLVTWDGEDTFRVVGQPRWQPDPNGAMQCCILDVERYEG